MSAARADFDDQGERVSDVPPPDNAGNQPEPEGWSGTAGLPRHPGTPPQESAAAPAAKPAQPPAIRNAVRLMWAGAVISLLSLVVTLATLGSLKTQVRDQLAQNNQKVTEDMVNAGYAAGIVGGVVVAIVAILLWLWMAWKNGQGRKWARIVATVLGVINVLSTLYTIGSGTAEPAAVVLAVINLVLAIAILVLLWRKEASAYYAACSAPAPLYG
jgi:hypothetical protein